VLHEREQQADQSACDQASYTLNEWCVRRRISRSMFYKLVKLGTAPGSYLVGNSRYITAEADEAWLAARHAENKVKPREWQAQRQAQREAV
jgi:predicted DNA-binding transcriptional regulator AlpA